VLVLGAGKVGEAAARQLKTKGVTVFAIDRDERAAAGLRGIADEVLVGDAADRATIERAGIMGAASVLLTTNDDAMNIYLAVYCRRLNPAIRIISRITHERNVEAIHRAGASGHRERSSATGIRSLEGITSAKYLSRTAKSVHG
jgi:Trk K+ transport system NAD-binding subunit